MNEAAKTQADISSIQICALRLLARREHSQYELTQKLLSRHFPFAEIEQVVADFAQKSWQSDERFAEMYVRNRINKGYGFLKIQAELRERGISADIIANYLTKDPEFWLELIQAIWQKKFGVLAKYGSPAFIKQQRFLQSRGFMGEEMKKLWATLYEK